jgi:hypothetical protein
MEGLNEEDVKKLCEIWDKEYKEEIELENLEDKKLAEILNNSLFDISFKDLPYLRYDRLITHIPYIKQEFEPNKTNIISASFRFYSYEKSACYGFIYSYYNEVDKNFIHHHITYGPSLTSEDGEYKGRTIHWDSFIDFFMPKYENIYDIVEELIVSRLNDGSLSYGVNIHCPNKYEKKDEYALEIDNNRLAIKIHVLCWLYDFYSIHNEFHENHMNDSYRKIIYRQQDVPYLEKILSILEDKDFQKLQLLGLTNIIVQPIKDKYVMYPPRIGQKLFPLNINEVYNIGDIRFPAWAEIYLTNICSNLSLNYVSPSFPFIVDWFYINNTNALAYDNMMSVRKYHYSKISKKITKKLRKVDLLNFIEEDTPYTKDFMKISQQIRRAVNFADLRLNLSQVSLCLMSEYVGRTFLDAYHLSKTASIEGTNYIFKEVALLEKFIFELIYAFHCMNTRVGIIHGDPHINNITLYQTFFNLDPRIAPRYANGVDTYIINNKAYSFQYTGEHAMIIDLSKGIIRDRNAMNNKYDKDILANYFLIQDNYFRQIVGRTFPELNEKHGDKIDFLLKEDPHEFFRLFSVVDTLIACRGIRNAIMLEKMLKDKEMEKYICDLLHDLLIYVEKEMTKEFLAVDITNYVKANATNERWIQAEALEVFYIKYNLDNETLSKKNIVCVYNSKANMKCDINVYEKWGDHISIEPRKAMRVANDTWNNKKGKVIYDRFMLHMRENRIFNKELEEKEKKKIIIEPWMLDF